MVDNNFSLIKPLESSQNLGGLAPTQRRNEKKRQQKSYGENEELPEDELNYSDEKKDSKNKRDEDDEHVIDYSA